MQWVLVKDREKEPKARLRKDSPFWADMEQADRAWITVDGSQFKFEAGGKTEVRSVP